MKLFYISNADYFLAFVAHRYFILKFVKGSGMFFQGFFLFVVFVLSFLFFAVGGRGAANLPFSAFLAFLITLLGVAALDAIGWW